MRLGSKVWVRLAFEIPLDASMGMFLDSPLIATAAIINPIFSSRNANLVNLSSLKQNDTLSEMKRMKR
jgi:hypothetical protein